MGLPLPAVLLAVCAALAGDPVTGKEAAKEFKVVTSLTTKAHAAATKAVATAFDKDEAESLAVIEADLSDPTAAIDDAFELLGSALNEIDNATRLNLSSLEAFGNEILADLLVGEPLPKDFLAGGGGNADKTLAKIASAAGKAVGKIAKRVKKFAGKLAKEDVLVAARVNPPVVPGIAMVPDEEATEPLIPLGVDAVLGASLDDGDDGDGWLWVGGFADPGNGFTVDVSINQEGVLSDSVLGIPIDIVSLRWSARFPSDALDMMPSGNYEITVTQGAHSFSSVAGVP